MLRCCTPSREAQIGGNFDVQYLRAWTNDTPESEAPQLLFTSPVKEHESQEHLGQLPQQSSGAAGLVSGSHRLLCLRHFARAMCPDGRARPNNKTLKIAIIMLMRQRGKVLGSALWSRGPPCPGRGAVSLSNHLKSPQRQGTRMEGKCQLLAEAYTDPMQRTGERKTIRGSQMMPRRRRLLAAQSGRRTTRTAGGRAGER